jgi:hypothetical protein
VCRSRQQSRSPALPNPAREFAELKRLVILDPAPHIGAARQTSPLVGGMADFSRKGFASTESLRTGVLC